MDEFNIENSDNYLSCYNINETEILSRYAILVNEFLAQVYESIKTDNELYFLYIITNGIETITHVYRFLLMYTKNSELAFYNCKKSIYYYIEFICQLSNNKGDFLKLTAKDASFFVYRKTVFAINQTFRKDYKQDKKTALIDDNIFYITELFRSCFRNSNATSIDTILNANDCFVEDITEMFKKTDPVCYNKKLKCLSRFCDCINKDKYEILSLIVRKITRKNIELASISGAVAYALSLDNITTKQFVNAIFSKCISC